MKVLSTKKLDENIISYARAFNLELTCIDFIKTKPVSFDLKLLPTDFDSVVFTSSNAVKYFLQNETAFEILIGKNIFSASGKTNNELLKHKIKALQTAESAKSLAELIIKAKDVKAVLHVCGNLVLDVLKKELEIGKIKYNALEVYETILQKEKVNDEYDAIMFFSPSGVESFFSENKLQNEIVCCCVGNTTADALKRNDHSAKIIVATNPSQQTMIDTIVNYFNTVSI